MKRKFCITFILSIILKKWFISIKNTTNHTKSTKYEISFFSHLGFGPIGPLALEVRPLHRLEMMGKERPLTERRIPEER